MNNIKKLLIKILIILGIFSLSFPKAMAAQNISISGPSSVIVGETVTVTLYTGDNTFNGNVSVSGAASGSKSMAPFAGQSDSISVKTNTTGTITFIFSGQVTPMSNPEKIENKTFKHIVNVNSNTTNSPVQTQPETRQETAEEKAAREKREAEAELEALKKVPLIEEIMVYSESDRLKGEKIKTISTEDEKFDYGYTLPRNIDAFKLDFTIEEGAEIKFDKMFKLDEGHDKVEVIGTAEKGEVKQEFKITVKRHKSSEVTFESDDLSLTLLNDNLIDKALKEYGIEKKLFDKDKDDTFYYYEYGNYKFALTFDEDNVARWVFLDDKGKFLDEFVLVIDQHDKPRFLVNVELEEKPTLQGNRYEAKELVLPESITSLDESIKFNNMINAWEFDETGVITHEYVEVESKDLASTDEELIDVEKSTPYKLVYVGKDAVVESAFVAFDEVNQNMMYLAISLFALLVLLLIVFIVYWRSTSKKINKLISRNSY